MEKQTKIRCWVASSAEHDLNRLSRLLHERWGFYVDAGELFKLFTIFFLSECKLGFPKSNTDMYSRFLISALHFSSITLNIMTRVLTSHIRHKFHNCQSMTQCNVLRIRPLDKYTCDSRFEMPYGGNSSIRDNLY